MIRHLVAMLFLLAVQAQAAVSVDIGRQFPADGVIATDKGFYVELDYTADEATYLWLRPWYQGREVRTGSNPSPLHAPGAGKALGWFFLHGDGARADSIQVLAGDGQPGNTREVARFPVDVQLRVGTPIGELPDWVTALLREQVATPPSAIAGPPVAADSSPSPWDWVLPTVFLLIVGSAILGPLVAAWRWRGGWRWLAVLPSLGMLGVTLRFFIDTARDPTSHNLWPLEFLWCSFLAWLAMAALMGLHHVLAGRSGHSVDDREKNVR